MVCLKVSIVSERARRMIGILSSATLDVYLIHVQPVFFREVFGKNLRNLTVSECGGWLCSLILLTSAIYVACTVLEFVRIFLFSTLKELTGLTKRIRP